MAENFGYTDIGGSTGSLGASLIRGASGSPASDGTATSLSFYARTGYWASGEKVKLALWDASDDSLVAETEERDSGGDGWQAFSINVAVFSAKTYLIGIYSDSGLGVHYTAAAGEDYPIHGGSPEEYPEFPDPITSVGTGYQYSCFCTYTPGVGPTNYDRSASVLVGSLTSASRLLAIDRDSAILIGNLVSAFKSRGIPKTASVLVGNLATASRIRGAVRTSSVLIGNLVSAIKTWNPLDIGALAIDRASSTAGGSTLIAKENPANLTGTLTQVEIYATVALASVKVGTFYATDTNDFICRDYAALGSVSSGWTEHTGLSIDVEKDDYIGIFFT